MRYFERVRQPVAEVVGIATGEDLGLGFETAEGAGVNDAVAVTLEVVAVGMLRLGEAASAGVFDVHRVRCQHGWSLAECGGAKALFPCARSFAALKRRSSTVVAGSSFTTVIELVTREPSLAIGST